MLNNPNPINDMLPLDTVGARIHRLAFDLRTYANYEQLAEAAADKGGVMKESADFYADRILDTLKTLLNGKTEEEIRVLLSDWQGLLEI